MPIVFLYELKRDLNLYLRDWATNTAIKTIADIVAFNEANAGKALRFGQDLFLAANDTQGDLSELEYTSARAMDLLAAKTRGMDAYMNRHKLDAVLFPGSVGAAIAAKAGYPSVMVPGGFISGVDGKDTPDYPLGITFAGARLERAQAAASGLRLRAGLQQAQAATWLARPLRPHCDRPRTSGSLLFPPVGLARDSGGDRRMISRAGVVPSGLSQVTEGR